jgi:hypothetical protein
MEELEINVINPTEGLLDNCEMYAKMALLMFYPFRQLTDLTCFGTRLGIPFCWFQFLGPLSEAEF